MPLQHFGAEGQQPLGQVILLQAMPKRADRGFVRYWVHGYPRKAARRLCVREEVFHPGVREPEPLLHKTDAQHGGQGYGGGRRRSRLG